MDSTSADVLSAWRRIYALESTRQPPPPARAPGDRAQADAQAAWLRWHQPQVAERFTPDEQPWYALFERARVETLAGLHLPGMQVNLADFATLAPASVLPGHLYRCARRLLASETPTPTELCLPASALPTRPRWFPWRQRPASAHPLQTLLLPALQSSRLYLQDANRFAETLQPLIQLLAMTVGQTDSTQGLSQPAASTDNTVTMRTTHRQAEGGAGTAKPYRVFSREWDELLDARQLMASNMLPVQEEITPEQHAEARRLARRLQQRLLALQVQHWNDEQEQGALDRRRLVAMVASGNPLVFRQEEERLAPQACVTLLLDQSGSMRGIPRALTLQAVDLAVQVLEACGVRSEVLGFGTRFAADNPLRREWEAAGCPPLPGRLNALRHILYKPANLPWRRCRQSLLRQPLAEGENIDGEALEWAASRLLRQADPRKILIVFSDGTPFDEATASANGRGYLEDHLHHSIAQIEARAVHLAAIGSSQGVTRYYRNGLVLQRAEQVSAVLFEQLADLLIRQR